MRRHEEIKRNVQGNSAVTASDGYILRNTCKKRCPHRATKSITNAF